MPQAHTLAVPTTTSRVHRLAPLVVVIVTAALFVAALIQGAGNDTPTSAASDRAAASVSEPFAPTARPDESKIAAAIAAGVTPAGSGPAAWSERPDESSVAAAVAGGR